MTRTPWRILVTAVGGDLGQALVKALRLSNVPIVLLGCDADEEGVGGAFVECFRVVPRANDKRYLDELMGLCREFGIQAVIPGSEPEIARLSRMGSSTPCLPSGIPVVCQDGPWIETFGDKLSCMRALEGKVELGAFADGSDARAVEELVKRAGFPMIVKSRRSSGSQSLRIARNGDELARHLAEVPIPLVQQYLDATGGEFSAGLFACDQFESTIVFRRELGKVGCSWFAETAEDPEVTDYVRRVGRAIGVRGSANVQVRKTDLGVRLLEVNPRFSSLAAARAVCGFRDVEWSLLQTLGLDVAPPAGSYKHIRFRRFFHELVDAGGGFEAITQWCPRVRDCE